MASFLELSSVFMSDRANPPTLLFSCREVLVRPYSFYKLVVKVSEKILLGF